MNRKFTPFTTEKQKQAQVWKCGSVEVWKCGSMEVWKCGSVEVWTVNCDLPTANRQPPTFNGVKHNFLPEAGSR